MFLLTRKTNVFAGMKGRSKENMYMGKSEWKEEKRNVPKGQKQPNFCVLEWSKNKTPSACLFEEQ